MFVAFIASHHIRMCCADVFTCSVLTRRCSISHAIIDGSGPKGRAGGSRDMHVNVANVCWKKKRWHFLRVRNEDVSRSRGIGCILSSVEHIPYTSTQAHNLQLHKLYKFAFVLLIFFPSLRLPLPHRVLFAMVVAISRNWCSAMRNEDILKAICSTPMPRSCTPARRTQRAHVTKIE